MEPVTIGALIRHFNIASVTILAFFAAFGVIAAIRRTSRANIFRVNAFLSAFCAAALGAFAVEATFFNFQWYLKFFAGPELHTVDVSPENPNIIRTSDGALAEMSVIKHDNSIYNVLHFKNLDRNVTSVFVDLDFGGAEMAVMAVEWTDENSTHEFEKYLYKRLPHENYTPIQPRGKVSDIKVTVGGIGGGGGVIQAALNKQIPLYFSGLRLLAVSLLFFAAILFFKKELRAKTAYYLFEYKFDANNRKQNLVYALSIVLLVLFSWLAAYTSFPKSFLSAPRNQQYNRFLVDAILEGRTYLDCGNPERLLDAERPYDPAWRLDNGYYPDYGKARHNMDTDVMWDWIWYKGKYYCYYGVVPAIILYVPYKLITGNYLSNTAGIFLFTAITITLLALLWRHCVKRWMPDSKFVFYQLSFLTLFLAGAFCGPLRFTLFYSIVQTAGIMFAVAGVLLLLNSVEKENINRPRLFFACLCLALVAGCRPNLIFVSLLVPIILWKYRSWKLLLFISAPYVIVAIPLCLYNYTRFGSIFEFGQTYCITIQNLTSYTLLNPIGKIIKVFESYIYYLFYPNKYMLHFPFVDTRPPMSLDSPMSPDFVTFGFFRQYERGSAMLNFPIVFCLFYMLKNVLRKDKPAIFSLLSGFLIVAFIIMTVDSLITGFMARYALDFAIFIVIPSLFCAYYWCGEHSVGIYKNKNRLAIVYVLLAASIFVGLFVFVNSTPYAYKTHELYRYLESSLGILREV